MQSCSGQINEQGRQIRKTEINFSNSLSRPGQLSTIQYFKNVFDVTLRSESPKLDQDFRGRLRPQFSKSIPFYERLLSKFLLFHI